MAAVAGSLSFLPNRYIRMATPVLVRSPRARREAPRRHRDTRNLIFVSAPLKPGHMGTTKLCNHQMQITEFIYIKVNAARCRVLLKADAHLWKNCMRQPSSLLPRAITGQQTIPPAAICKNSRHHMVSNPLPARRGTVINVRKRNAWNNVKNLLTRYGQRWLGQTRSI